MSTETDVKMTRGKRISSVRSQIADAEANRAASMRSDSNKLLDAVVLGERSSIVKGPPVLAPNTSSLAM